MRKLISLIFLSSLFFMGCSEKPREEIVEKFPDGTPKIVHYYRDNGKIKEKVREIQYYPNHNKFYDGEFKNDLKDGHWTVWYDNGNIWSDGYFIKGKDDGKRTGYYEDGKKHFEGKYDNGKLIGKWQFWDEKGVMVKDTIYK
jgi:antitoxin component YwqK of YwqJK toxin-antitoxin module